MLPRFAHRERQATVPDVTKPDVALRNRMWHHERTGCGSTKPDRAPRNRTARQFWSHSWVSTRLKSLEPSSASGATSAAVST